MLLLPCVFRSHLVQNFVADQVSMAKGSGGRGRGRGQQAAAKRPSAVSTAQFFAKKQKHDVVDEAVQTGAGREAVQAEVSREAVQVDETKGGSEVEDQGAVQADVIGGCEGESEQGAIPADVIEGGAEEHVDLFVISSGFDSNVYDAGNTGNTLPLPLLMSRAFQSLPSQAVGVHYSPPCDYPAAPKRFDQRNHTT